MNENKKFNNIKWFAIFLPASLIILSIWSFSSFVKILIERMPLKRQYIFVDSQSPWKFIEKKLLDKNDPFNDLNASFDFNEVNNCTVNNGNMW